MRKMFGEQTMIQKTFTNGTMSSKLADNALNTGTSLRNQRFGASKSSIDN